MKEIELENESRVECKKVQKLSNIIWAVVYFALCSVPVVYSIYNLYSSFVKGEEMNWFLLFPITIGIFFMFFFINILLNNPVYIFTREEIKKRHPLFPFFGEDTVCQYKNIDRYLQVYADYMTYFVTSDAGGATLNNAAEYWFMSGDKVMFVLPANYKNVREARKILPIRFAGEVQLSRKQYENHDIRGAQLIQRETPAGNNVMSGNTIFLVAKNGEKPGCFFYFLLILFVPSVLMLPVLIFSDLEGSMAGVVFLLASLAFFAYIFFLGRKKGWVTIDEKNGILKLESGCKPLVKDKYLPIAQLQMVRVDRRKNKTTFYDDRGVWCEFLNSATKNFPDLYQALILLHSKGKIKLEIVEG